MRTPAGVIELDAGGRVPGRGAYMCTDEACWTAAVKRGALATQLRVAVPRATIEELGDQMAVAREQRLAPAMSN